MSETASISRRKAWLMAARPQTLPAAASPVIVGTAVAANLDSFALGPALAALVGAALIQIGTNFANDYYDAVKGADTDDREGFTRVTAGGLISPGEVRRAMAITFAVAILSGVYLVYVGGIPIVLVGLLGIASGVLYTGGPYPLGYHGLGDAFVFFWFGLVAVTGTYYVQAVSAGAWLSAPLSFSLPAGTGLALAASLPMAAISTDILVVNNVRDLETDVATGKHTLAVMFGYRAARAEFVAMLVLAYATPVYLWLGEGLAPMVLLPLGTIPYALGLARTVLRRTDGEALNPALEQTGKLLAAFAVTFAIGLVV